MKIQVSLVIMTLLVSFSCKDNSSKNEKSNETEITLSSEKSDSKGGTSLEKAKDCDDFIDQYEAWSEEYVAFLSKYKDDPMKAVTSPEYSEMMLKASSWSQQWLTLSVSCAQNSSYDKRFGEIADKMDEKMEELGFK